MSYVVAISGFIQQLQLCKPANKEDRIDSKLPWGTCETHEGEPHTFHRKYNAQSALQAVVRRTGWEGQVQKA